LLASAVTLIDLRPESSGSISFTSIGLADLIFFEILEIILFDLFILISSKKKRCNKVSKLYKKNTFDIFSLMYVVFEIFNF
jgi:hypothetical protein